jgi:hypothetical protein
LSSGEGTLTVNGTAGVIVSSPSDQTLGLGINYTLHIPMDAGTVAQLYEVTAMRPLVPFTISVSIGGVHYVPIQMTGKVWGMGKPGQSIRLDLTLGVDSNNDGLPDSWQQEVVNADKSGTITSIDQVAPNALAGNGLTNMQNFLLGLSSLDSLDGVRIDVIGVSGGVVHLQFLGVTGRTYTIKSSTDSLTWAAQPFSVSDPTVATPSASYIPTSTGIMDAYVTWTSPTKGYFQLFAQ